MIILTGYYLDTVNAVEIQDVLREMQDRIVKRATKKYQELLEHEIEMLVDYSALNAIQRPNGTILENAEKSLMNRIRYASINQLPTAYNFNVSVHLFYDEGKTFIRLNANNNIYRKCLSDIKGLNPFNADDNEIKDKGNGEVWKYLMKAYECGLPVAGVQMLTGEGIVVDYEKLKFKSPAVRADYLARYNLVNRLLNMFGNNEQIPGFRLMELFDDSLNALSTDFSKNELRGLKSRLISTLPNITYALISRLPSDQVDSPGDEQKTNNTEEAEEERDCECNCETNEDDDIKENNEAN